jgi:glutamine synthetase adenylyltransferase
MIDAMTPLADVIYQHVRTMPQYAVREVLNFIQFLEFKQTHTVPRSVDNADLLAFIQNLPKGHRDATDIDREFQALRDEWGQL